GDTDWNQVGNDTDETVAINSLDTAKDSGLAWGVIVGYQFSKLFAVEGNFTRFARTTVNLDPLTIYQFPPYNLKELSFKSSTETYLLLFKVMVPFAFNNNLNFMVNVGFGSILRSDPLRKTSRLAPSFGAGFNYDMTKRVFSEVGFQYTPGFGRATETPLIDYIPFVYSIHYKLGLRFPLFYET
ncbi:MAG: outer membrane beta-barrel protein, partial [Pseudomonadota bacterium]